MKYYHNPRCTKSREGLELLQKKKATLDIVEYMKTPPTAQELGAIVKKLGVSPEEIVRKNEDLYKTKYKDKKLTDDQWLKILSENPELIQRPIGVTDKKAAIGRPTESLLDLL